LKPRLLFCITVYNGRAFVPAAIQSAMRLDQTAADVDVLVLDDCSPEPGWSEELEKICAGLGASYYRSPRNLGIPRNVSLGMRTAAAEGYDYVIISNSDVLLPHTLISDMMAVGAQPDVGSVTAWSNNVSAYSIPNRDPDKYLADQDVVDWIAATLNGHFGDAALDIPAGISFCILIPIRVVEDVGVMDPVFGRGYCEETDWTLRSLERGYRIALCPGTFVYHSGSGSTHGAGILTPGRTTVVENEAIIDMRYPQFRSQVRAFLGGGILQDAHNHAITQIIAAGARQYGYTVDVGWLPRPPRDQSKALVVIAPNGSTLAKMTFLGFDVSIPTEGNDIAGFLEDLFRRPPDEVNLLDHGARDLASTFGNSAEVNRIYAYPTRV
jgi:GT2 family glycosyltransferase